MAVGDDKNKDNNRVIQPPPTPPPGGGNPYNNPQTQAPAPSTTGLPGGGGLTLFERTHPNEKDVTKWTGREALRQVLADMGIADTLPMNLTDIEDTAQKIKRWEVDLNTANEQLMNLAKQGGFMGLTGADPRKVAAAVDQLGQAQGDLAAVKQTFLGYVQDTIHPTTGKPAVTDDPGRVREREFIYQKTGKQLPVTGEDWESLAKGLMHFKDLETNAKAEQKPDQLTIQALQEAQQLYGKKFDEYSQLIFGGGGKDLIKTPDGRYIDRAKMPGGKMKGNAWPVDVKPGWYTEMGATDEPTADESKMYAPKSQGGMGLSPGDVQRQQDAAAAAKAAKAQATATAAYEQEYGGPARGWVRDRGSLRPVGSVVTGSLQSQ